MSNLEDFVDFLWEDTQGYVNLSLLSTEGAWKRSFAEWPRQRKAVVNFISQQTAEGSEVYMAPSMWKQKPEPGIQYSKELFLGTHVLWCEFDGNAPSFSDSNSSAPENPDRPVVPAAGPAGATGVVGTAPGDRASAATTGAARGGIAAGQGADSAESSAGKLWIPQPSWKIQSSSADHLHTYWKLESFLQDAELAENLNRTLAMELGADNCWDVTRVLRPPDTTNYGIGKDDRKGKTYPVVVEESSDRKYQLDKFKQTKDFRPLVKESLGAIPELREILARHEWDEEFWKAFSDTPAAKTRSDALQLVAYYGAESGFTNEEIFAVIQDCDDRWGKYVGRNDRERRLIDIVDRARAKHPLGTEILTFDGLLGNKNKPGLELAPEAVPEQVVYTLDEFLHLEVQMNWLVDNLLPVGGYGIIAGPNGLGKTQMGIRLAEALIKERAFLNIWQCSKPNAKAMFLSLEMELPELKQFYAVMDSYGGFFETVDASGRNRFLTVPIGNAIPLDKEEGLRLIESYLAEFRPDLLVIDSYSMAISGDFKQDGPVIQFNKMLKRLRKQFGVAVVIIHHNRKGQDKKFRYNELDDLYGSRFLPQDASFVLMVDKPKTLQDNQLAINTAKMRFKKPDGEIVVIHEEMNFTGGYVNDGSLPDFSSPEAARNTIAREVKKNAPRSSPNTNTSSKPPENGETSGHTGF